MRYVSECVAFMRFHILHRRSRKVIEKWQTDRLRRLLVHAEKNVPLYKELMATQNIRATDISTLENLSFLPVINKKTFIGRQVVEYTDGSRHLSGQWVTTSGSSGVPFTALRRTEVQTLWYGYSLNSRFLTWEMPWRLNADWARVAHIRVRPRERKNHLWIPLGAFLNNPRSLLQQIVDFKPDVVESFASVLYVLAREVDRYGIVWKPRYVVSGGEQLSPAGRLFIENTLGCEVYNRYGLEELGTVGVECMQHDGLHINSESLIVEIVDESGASVPETNHGRVIITDLFNTSMPFVRYDTGDRGHMSWARCACGLRAPRLWIEGRYSTFLQLGDQTFHHFYFSYTLKPFKNQILQYQVVKRAENDLLIRIIPGSAFGDETTVAIQKEIANLVKETASVRVECVAEIKRMPRGKSQVIVDETAGTQKPDILKQ